MSEQLKVYVITGGPCSGKTAVINRLHERGYLTIPEVATEVIINLRQTSPSYNPARDRYTFQDVVARQQLSREQRMVATTMNGAAIFTDRGVFDGIGYCEVDGIGLESSAFRLPGPLRNLELSRYRKAFFMEQLPQGCYEQTGVRQEDPVYAARITAGIKVVYERMSSTLPLVVVPHFDTNGDTLASIDRRVNFILGHLNLL